MYVVSNRINYEYINIKIIKIYRIKKIWLNNYNKFVSVIRIYKLYIYIYIYIYISTRM